jgi:copper chaperone for superoxide dismutase
VDVTIDGLAPETDYCVEVHKFGDLSKGAESTGPLFAFGVLAGTARKTSAEGRLEILSVLSGHHVWELIGRSIVIRLDLAPGAAVPAEAMACAPVGMPQAVEGSGGGAIAAVIARSAGVGANHKMLCACDGTVIWDAEALMPGGSGRARPGQA